ncbi:MAG: hypothetical protein H6659_08660 [Ardenticatenaceae bacterium]|nr:hypothetical protein [Ardenticatenaceae bacterium]
MPELEKIDTINIGGGQAELALSYLLIQEVGLHWLHTCGSALLYGVGEDAELVVENTAVMDSERLGLQ